MRTYSSFVRHADSQMVTLQPPTYSKRYSFSKDEKTAGAVYTPKNLADFVANQIVQTAGTLPTDQPLRIFDPAIGQGSLLLSLLECLEANHPKLKIEVFGFETDRTAIDIAKRRLVREYPAVTLNFKQSSFLDFVLERFGEKFDDTKIFSSIPAAYDLIIANPPYVRTQILGAMQAQLIAKQFGLSGRIDLYYAFTLGIVQVLKSSGIAGIIVSNRFMTTKSGASLRKILFDGLRLQHVWDLGDTKLFDAAVLPAVLIFKHKNIKNENKPSFTTIYQTSEPATVKVKNPIQALDNAGVIEVEDGRIFHIRHGHLDTNGELGGVWRVATKEVDEWLERVDSLSWGTFRDIGKVRVGVKTCADKVFIRNDWKDMPALTRPELLKPISTHHIARRFKPRSSKLPREILYPHESVLGRRRAIDIRNYPKSQSYLEAHRDALQGRRYVIDAGRKWYEIWVPQDPNSWSLNKLICRDIAEEPTFWIDLDGTVVNGDCYWLISEKVDLLWLAAAVGNSSFIKHFYDFRFQNKLYSNRRRFITQYVEKFPLPDPNSPIGKCIIDKAKLIYEITPASEVEEMYIDLDNLVWKALTGGTSSLS